ncbi:stress-inducible protein [Streptomyces ruber]|uniref:Stress-inducible protein n=2 Tax=Streptomyces TaxID=1883 RepID=A0A918B9D1_9ACTN|nr:universal stress protein [Streptomyces ruber]GGQ48888.1 stress-inducible protein [Streptomyces ruber]
MPRTITVGVDGSPESRAAAEWAAREARLRDLPVKLVHVRQPLPEPTVQVPLPDDETPQHWYERIPREAAEGLRLRHPGVEVSTEQRAGTPADALVDAARDAELLVLGSRALSGIGGFLVGSVGQAVVARTEAPVVLVRAGEQAADEHVMDPAGIPSAATAFRPVVLGLDTGHPDDTVLAFAFEEAQRRGTALHAVQVWNLPPYSVYDLVAGVDLHAEAARRWAAELTGVLRPWRQKYPDVEVVETSRTGSPAARLVDAARDASLVVVGRRIRRSPFGVHIGSVTHAVLHHSTAPVAVVAHD